MKTSIEFQRDRMMEEYRTVVSLIIGKVRLKEDLTPDFVKKLGIQMSMELATTIYHIGKRCLDGFPKSNDDVVVNYVIDYCRSGIIPPDVEKLIEQGRTDWEVSDEVNMNQTFIGWCRYFLMAYNRLFVK